MLDPEKIFERANRLHASIINEITRPIKNFESVPKKALIRVEYVKCGKPCCNKCSVNFHYRYHGHGPYFFAYFRDKENRGRLKKKYIGEIDPRNPYFKEFLDKLKNY